MRLTLLFALLLFAKSFAAAAEDNAFRTWTDTQQRRVEATFVRADGAKVVLKLRNGSEATVPLASLSEADRKWVAEQPKPTATPAQPATPPAVKDWPRMVTLKDTPTVTVVRENPEKKEYIYETEHYEFVCDSPLGANLVREFSKIFETTWLLNCVLPLDIKPAPEDGRKKFRARIFTYESDYTDAGGPKGSSGVYMLLEGELKLPLSSLGVKMFGSRVTVDYAYENYSTLIHEITHQMMCHWIPKLPIWYVEGAAVYAEIAKYQNGRFSFLQPEKRLRDHLLPAGGGTFQMVPLEKLMNMGGHEWLTAVGTGSSAGANYASGVALTYYFYHIDDDGKGTHFIEYMRAVEKLQPGESDAPLMKKYLLRDRDYDTLQKDVQKGLHRMGINVDFSE
ncbi:MAG: SHD1 domain-containing protein [Chthoniobacterales bacterium]